MLSYFTTGESHGKGIITIIKGLPVGLTINIKEIYSELKRRRLAAGRGPRMKRESDKIEILSGIRKGKTIGTPLTILVRNYADTIDRLLPLTKVRPGHIDLASAMKFLSLDGRPGAERSSARETLGRVIAGSIVKSVLNYFDIHIFSYVTQIGSIKADCTLPLGRTPCESKGQSLYSKYYHYAKLKRQRDNYFYGIDIETIKKWQDLLNEVRKNGDTLGGIFEVVGFNVPVGLGDHTHWEDKLGARLSQAIIAIPAVKGIEIGLGFDYSHKLGSQAHDLFLVKNNHPLINKSLGWKRITNYAGGIEGGLSNGENILIRAVVKPIPTLKNPLPTIDILTKHLSKAEVESSDICAVPAASVVGEAVVAFEIARAFMNKFGADTLLEMSYNFKNYQRILRKLFT